jgi:hypothetical protein
MGVLGDHVTVSEFSRYAGYLGNKSPVGSTKYALALVRHFLSHYRGENASRNCYFGDGKFSLLITTGKGETLFMGVMVIVAYRPRPGKQALLLALTHEHLGAPRAASLATERPSYAMQASDGTVIEVFEWKSKEAITAAHTRSSRAEDVGKYAEACEYVPLANVKECSDTFAEFVPIELTDS